MSLAKQCSCVLLALQFTVLTAFGQDFTGAQLEHFEKSIRPLLIDNCIACHGPQRQEGELRLDSREAILRGGVRGPAYNTDDPKNSVILEAVRHANGLKMPPEKKLTHDQIRALERWITHGAAWSKTFTLPAEFDPTKHWAFQPNPSPAPPTITGLPDSVQPIDRFIIRRLMDAELTMNPPADRITLMRRAYQDTIGLPPTPEQAATFLNDDSPSAYEKMVDSLLASPQFGVHWARMWMDIARYADNKGYIFYLNREFQWAYTYRDYLIESFNEDRSFKRMILEQLAADQLELADDRRPLRAMGFVTLGDYFVNNKYDMIDDRIDVITRGLMGLTVTCARCHDHKFDPIPTADYYSLYGVLNSSHDPIVPPLYATPPDTPEYQNFSSALRVKQQTLETFLETTITNLREDGRTRISEYLLAAYRERNNPNSDDFMLLTDKGALNPRMIRRWINHLKEQPDAPTSPWYIWNQYSKIDQDQFANDQLGTFKSLSAIKSELNSFLVPRVLNTPPKNMEDLAQRYQNALLEVKAILNQEGPLCDDPDILQLGLSLYGESAPADIPVNIGFDFLDLFPDRATQAEFKKLLEDVEGFIRNDPAAPPRALVLHDNKTATEPYVFMRGNPNNRGNYVQRKFLTILSPDDRPFEHGSGRLELAQRIASDTNPLTARVLVNRLWAKIFGLGIVATTSDFGLRGTKPSHPMLLDYLANQFIESGWSVKTLIRQMLLSQAYQQSSASEHIPDIDPTNLLLWRSNRKRLTWEQTRDALLQVTGEMNLETHGRSFDLNNAWLPRRTVFGYINRLDIPTLLRTFDYPSPNTSSGSRSSTTIPQQALWFLNNDFLRQVVTRVRSRLDKHEFEKGQQQVSYLYSLFYSRTPEQFELETALDFLANSEGHDPLSDLIQVLLMSNEFVYLN